MVQSILFIVVLGALLFFSISSAATYFYVNTSGNLQSIEANNPTEAIAIAPNRAVHSGVMLVSGTTSLSVVSTSGATLSTGTNTYLYIDTSGNLRTVVANNPTEAIAIALNIAVDSGVMTSN